jgi:hypothetical protein
MLVIARVFMAVVVLVSGWAVAQPPTARVEGGQVLYLYGLVDASGDRPGEAGYSGEPFHAMRLDDPSPLGFSSFAEAIRELGYTVQQAYDRQVTLDERTLAEVDVLILGSNNRLFTEAEAEALERWVRSGGGLIAWSDSAMGGDHSKVGLGNPVGRDSNNSLTERFGMHFLVDTGHDYSGPANKTPGVGITQWERPHALNNHETDGLAEQGLVVYGEGVSPVRIRPPAVMLARLQNRGQIGVGKVDRPYQPERDAAVAVAEIGDGRVIGYFDRNTFFNRGGPGTDLTEVSNRAFAQRMVLWADGVTF